MKPLFYDMINPLTGTPFEYGDPNLFYGYYLEPGDPGFTPTLQSAKPNRNPNA